MASVVHLVLRDDGSAGVVVGTRDNWTGRAIAFSLLDIERVRRELDQAGVYVLVGSRDADDAAVAYIGEAEVLADRLRPPHRQLGRDDVSWQRVVIFVSGVGELHKAHIKWLESSLVARARDASRCVVLNEVAPSVPHLPEHDRVFAASFLEKMLGLFPLLGVEAFEVSQRASAVRLDPAASPDVPQTGAEEFRIERGGVVLAVGIPSARGMILLQGSRIARMGTGSEGSNVARVRALLIENGKLAELDEKWWQLIDDYEMSSPSAAAKLVVGSSVSGNLVWRASDGRPLGQVLSELEAVALTPG